MLQRESRSRKEAAANGMAFAVAVGSVVGATLLRFLLAPLLGPHVPFITYFLAIVVGAWAGGWRGGLTTILLSTLAAAYFFVPPTHSLLIKNAADQVSVAIFILVGLGICAIGDAQRRRGRELAASEERYRRIVETTSEGIWMIDADSRTTYVNPQMARILGYTAEEMQGASLFDFMDEQSKAIAAQNVARRREGIEEQHDFKFHRKDGTEVWGIIATNPLHDERGRYAGALALFTDITERKKAEQELRARAEREALLNQINQALRGTIDADEIQQAAVRALGRALAVDRCYFSLLSLSEDSSTVGLDFHRDDLPSLAGRYRIPEFEVNPEDYYPAGQSLVINDLHTWSFPGPLVAALEQLRVRSGVSVPLYEGGRLVATLAVAMADEPRAWTAEEVSLVETVAVQTRTAVEAARVRQREQTIATQLQAALQPALPSAVTGLAVHSFYKAALKEAGVGGDFCDVFSLENDCTALVVGDLAGKGLAAAAQVATVRNMVRYAIFRSRTLAGAITNLNDVLVEQELLSGFSTLFVGTYDSAPRTLTYVNCGQEPALVYHVGAATVEQLPPTGPILGGFTGAAYTERVIALAPGDVVAIFTDGLTEASPTRVEMLTVEGVAAFLAQQAAQAQEQEPRQRAVALVSGMIADVTAYEQGSVRDDVCLLVGVIT